MNDVAEMVKLLDMFDLIRHNHEGIKSLSWIMRSKEIESDYIVLDCCMP